MNITEPSAVPQRKSKEFDSRNIPPTQKSALELPALAEEVERGDIVLTDADRLQKEYAEGLAFANEPIDIMIHRSGEKFASLTTDLVAVNGIKAEILFRNGWVQIGYLPRGVRFTTRRKYVEVLAASKNDDLRTETLDPYSEHPRNLLHRTTRNMNAFSVFEDTHPKGAEWLARLLRQN